MGKGRYCSVFAVVLSFIAFAAGAADEDAFKGSYVNMLRVANEYEAFREAVAAAENKIKETQALDETKMKEYEAKITELTEKSSGPLTPEGKAAVEAEIEKTYWEAVAYREEAFANYERIQRETLEPVYKDIYEKIAEVAGKEGYDVVFDYELLLYVGENFTDITEQVVSELNAEFGAAGP